MKMSLGSFIRRFAGESGGNVVMTFGLVTTVLIGLAGAAVDYSTTARIRSKLQAAVDSGVLAAALSFYTANADTVVHAHVDRSIPNGITPTITIAKTDNRITATLTGDVPTTLLGVMGISSLPIRITSTAVYGTGNAEVILVLDTTGSMAGSKISGLQQAANDFVTTLFSSPNAANSLKIGIVPFTDYVNIGTQYRTASWVYGASDYSTTSNQCWDTYPSATYTNPRPRSGTCYNDGQPYTCTWTDYDVTLGAAVQQCGPVTANFTWNGCVGSRASPLDLGDTATAANPVPAILNVGCSAPLQRLTNDRNALKTKIDGLVANGNTYIAPGVLWGWRLLSPNQPFADGAAFDGKTRKIMVVMTDGANTKSPNYPDHEGGDVALANELTTKTCANVKSAGIEVYSVAFSVTDTTIKTILANCASVPPNYYDSTTVSDLQAAFQKIANDINNVRLTN